jgi:predicted dehydrogenase
MSMNQNVSRRQFLTAAAGTAAGVVGFPYIISSSALGKTGNVAPSERITMGCIGVGWQGGSNMGQFLGLKDCRVVAICDVDKKTLQGAVNSVNRRYGSQDCAAYNDFRELLARTDIDAVSLGLPDHWHAIPAIEAARSGKDIFGEKPLSHDFRDGRAMCNAVKQYGRIWQTGSWQRSQAHFRFACELVRNGRIGKVHTVEVGLPAGHSDFAKTAGQEQIVAPPEGLDFDRWIGPAPYTPYRPALLPKNWRWVLDYGGGQLMDWIGHRVDIAHWGMGWDNTGPLEIEGTGEYPKDGLYDSPTRYRLTAKYPGGVTMVIAGGHKDIRGGTKWIGDKGWVWVSRGDLTKSVQTEPKELKQEKLGPNDVHLYDSPGHWQNFLDCIKSRQETITPCEAAHRSATPGHLGRIAMWLGRKLRFNPETEEIIGDPVATAMLGRPYRSPWHL